MKSLNILILSSRPQEWFANLGKDVVDVLEKHGHHVDWAFQGMQEHIKSKNRTIKKLNNSRLYRFLYYSKTLSLMHKLGFFLLRERLLPISRYGFVMVNGH